MIEKGGIEMKVKVLMDAKNLVEVVMPDGAFPVVQDGKFVIRVGKVELRSWRLGRRPKWLFAENGELVQTSKESFAVPSLEVASNPVIEIPVAAMVNEWYKVDVKKFMADAGRFELAREIQKKIARMRNVECKRVFIAYRKAAFNSVIPADSGGNFGATVFHHVAMVGC